MTAPLPSRPFRSLVPLLALALCRCGQPDAPAASRPLAETTAPARVSEDDPGCERWPKLGTRPRKVVVSHPYDVDGSGANVYEVLDLSADGKLSQSGQSFTMGRLSFGHIVFTPDGEVGLTTQDDGSIGVFRFDAFGVAHVVHAAFTGAGYAGNLTMDPLGNRVYVLDDEWRESGGGIYSVRIGCDGTLTSEGLLAAAKLPAGLAILPPGRRDDPPTAVLAATDVLDSAAASSVHLLHFSPFMPAPPTVSAGADAFGDDLSIVSAVARTPDARYALIGDNSEFSGVANRIAVVAIAGDTLRPVQVLTPLNDPVAIVMSPFANAGLVVSGYGNAILRLAYDPTATTKPLTNKGAIPYVGKRPQLPSNAELIERGALRGRVLVAELEGVRQVAFQSDGTITDLGLFALGSDDDLSSIVGVVGVQP